MKYLSWIAQIIAAIILLQTLFFKFTAAPEPVYIFNTLGLGDTGRIGIGVLELIDGILLLIPATTWAGAILGIGLMAGALMGHLTKLGIEVTYPTPNDGYVHDGGALFSMALLVLMACLALLYFDRKRIPVIGKML